MADNVELDAGSGGAVIATDDDGVAQHQYVKLEAGADGTQTKIHAGGGVEANALRVTVASDSTGVLSVDDNGGSLTVDGTVAVTGVATDAKLDTIIGHVDGLESALTAANASLDAIEASAAIMDNVVFGAGTEAAAQRVTIASDSTGVLSVDDNGSTLSVDDGGSSLTVDYATTGSGTATGALRVELPTNGTGVIATVGAVTAITNALPAGTNGIGKLTANSGVDIGDVDVTTVGTITPGTAATSLGKAEDAAHASGDVGVMMLGVRSDTLAALAGTTGDYTPPQMNATGAMYVEPVGNVAHDGADAGSPVKTGAKAGSADQTAVANNDRTDIRADTLGHQVVRPYALHENLISAATAAITNTTSTSVLAAAGAGVRNYVTSVLVTNSHATVGTLVTITDGSGGTTLYAGYAAPVGGGFALSFPTPLRGSANTAIHAVCGTTGSNTYVSASGYKSAV